MIIEGISPLALSFLLSSTALLVEIRLMWYYYSAGSALASSLMEKAAGVEHAQCLPKEDANPGYITTFGCGYFAESTCLIEGTLST